MPESVVDRDTGNQAGDGLPLEKLLAAVDLIVGQLQRNEFGVPPNPKVVTIRGTWAEGQTVRKRD